MYYPIIALFFRSLYALYVHFYGLRGLYIIGASISGELFYFNRCSRGGFNIRGSSISGGFYIRFYGMFLFTVTTGSPRGVYWSLVEVSMCIPYYLQYPPGGLIYSLPKNRRRGLMGGGLIGGGGLISSSIYPGHLSTKISKVLT
jgi:hypothetical protein